jgi:hypothetical protein
VEVPAGGARSDEGGEMRGRDAIREWMEQTIRKYPFTVDLRD